METIFLSIYLTTVIFTLLYINLPTMHGPDYNDIHKSYMLGIGWSNKYLEIWFDPISIIAKLSF
ncbi:hypothetical protein [Neobacillus cucumis]|uniref:hypothetical protein n=1 Tax=Neobacillus cucumis TaxID=1740721 RepID=UPI001964E81D|nr:hypothetical protein [Neobacillus cucumis]MBM7652187.1 hypothetical protein [Neobacillus cucumis]